jgi:uncharacterized protein YlxP (DUF503 family)
MIVGISVLELHLPAARSLKDKRRVVKGLVERLHQRHRVSVAETAFHDLLQRAEIGIAAVGRSEGEVEHLLEDLRRLVDGESEAMVVKWEPLLLEELG